MNGADVYRQSRRAAAWAVGVSLGLGAIKLLGGLFGHSVALLSDAIHSLVDALLSATLLGALSLAQRPPDREHPYGHARVEAVAGQAIALFLMALAVGMGWHAVVRSETSSPAPERFTLAVAAAGAVIQEGLYRIVYQVGRRTGSAALRATAWDFRLDALGSLAVLIGVAAACWGGESWHWADHAAAVFVAATIFWIGTGLLWENVQALIDRQAEPALLEAVRREAREVAGVLGVETLRVRKSGLEYLVDIHIEVDPDQTVRDGHAIAHAVKDRLMDRFATIRDVLVHVEPFHPSWEGLEV